MLFGFSMTMFGFLALHLFVPDASALSCMELPYSKEVFLPYTLIFEGVLIERKTPDNPPYLGGQMNNAGLFHFKVLQVWKGNTNITDIHVWATADEYNRIPYSQNKKYLVYAQKRGDLLISNPNQCGPDHMFHDNLATTLLQKHFPKPITQELTLTLSIKEENITLDILAHKGSWHQIADPQQSPYTFSFVVTDEANNVVNPQKREEVRPLQQSFSLQEGERKSFSFPTLGYQMGDHYFSYELNKGARYRVQASYYPYDSFQPMYTSNELFFEYMP